MGEKTVLIVDDSRLAQMLTQKTIKQAFPEWKIVTASNAEDGIAALEQTPAVSMALIDYNMPGMNGLEMAAQLIEKHPNLKINLVTANIQEKMRMKAEALGIGFINKPISLKKLTQAFNTI